MKFSVLTIAAIAVATSGTFFCNVAAKETVEAEKHLRALKKDAKKTKHSNNKCKSCEKRLDEIEAEMEEYETRLESCRLTVDDLLDDHHDDKTLHEDQADEILNLIKDGDIFETYVGYKDDETGHDVLLEKQTDVAELGTDGKFRFKSLKTTAYNGYNPVSEEEKAEVQRISNQRGERRGGAIAAAGMVLKFLKQGYDILKENKPVQDLQVATSMEVIAQGSTADEYANAKDIESGEYWFVKKGPFGVKTAEVRGLKIHGQTVTSSQHPGEYLINTYVNVGYAYNVWGTDLKGTVSLSSPSNVGSEESPIAQLRVIVAFKYGSLLEASSITIPLIARGDGQFSPGEEVSFGDD